MVINALSYVPSCTTHRDGEIIGQMIDQALSRGQPVTVSFHGVNSLPPSFVNTAFVALLRKYSLSYIKSQVRVVDSNFQINNMIKHRLERGGAEKLLA